ncbi:MAG: hypothetical protein ACOYYJ_22135 [Chloroflexota bacterium]
MTTPMSRPNPYVGPRSFMKGERLYGRDLETAELVDLIVAERIVLMYSPSGAGKSSLVNASIIPGIEKQGFRILPIIRVNHEPPAGAAGNPDFNRYVHSALLSMEEEVDEADRIAEPELLSMTFSAYLARARARKGGKRRKASQSSALFLIFDQLEEVLTQNPTDRAAKMDFFMQVGEALRDQSVWALFVIREDYLAGLDPFLRPVPTRLANRFRLDLLGVSAAVDAIQKPAKDVGVNFSEDAAAKLVDDLRLMLVQLPDGTSVEQPGSYVEPVQLQVVCRRLWGGLGSDARVTLEDVQAAGSTDEALADYYAMQVESVAADSGVKERAIREWVDRKLITVHGIRSQVLMEPDQSGELSNQAISLLQQAYIVRAEKRAGAVWFELAHDRLINPVRKNNADWFSANLNVFQRQADLWHSQGRPDGLLLTGKDFLEAELWAGENSSMLTDVEKEFLQDCKKAYASARREHQTNLLVRWLLAAATIISIIAVFFFFRAREQEQRARAQESIALDNARQAEQNAQLAIQSEETAIRSEKVARARELSAAALSNLTVDPERSVLLALQAVEVVSPPVPEAEDALRRSLPAMRVERVLGGYNGSVYSVRFSADGRRVATASNDGTVVVWDVFSGNQVYSIPVVSPEVQQAAGGATQAIFSPGGKTLAVSTSDGWINLYQASDGQEVRRIQAHDAVIWGMAFSPDATRIASASEDNLAKVWDVESGNLLLTLEGHQGGLQSIAYSPDGTSIATTSADWTAILWDSGTGKIVKTLVGHSGIVNGVTFSPDGKKLATSGGDDRSIKLWEVESGRLLMTITGHRDWVYEMAFTRAGSTLVSVSSDRTVRFWDTIYGRPQGNILYGHSDQIFSLSLSPDNKRLATASEDRTVRVWNISPEGGRELYTIDNRTIAMAIALSPDGTRLASAGRDRNIRLWTASTGRFLSILSGHTDIVEAIAFSPDGTRMASSARDGTAIVWDAGNNQELFRFQEHDGQIWDLAFSPDGARIATAGQDGAVKVWDAATGEGYHTLRAAYGAVLAVEFSPDGKWIASGHYRDAVVLWDADTGQRVATLSGHADVVQTLAFSPDSRWLASSGDDGSILLWDMASEPIGAKRGPLIDRGDTIFGVAFSPDGKYLLSGGADGIASVWDLETDTVIKRLYGSQDRIYGVAFNPDGSRMFTGGADSTVRAYLFDFQQLVSLAQKRVTRQFTEEECQEFLNEACPADSGLPAPEASDVAVNPPPEPPKFTDSQITDEVSEATAGDARAPGGDDFTKNLFERPFNANSMGTYYPDIDIQGASLSQTGNWVYVTIEVVGQQLDSEFLGSYAVEFDLNGDGRGDTLVNAFVPGEQWSTTGVRVWKDTNRDVGNGVPVETDPPQTGNGYETIFFDQGRGDAPDLAWARIMPQQDSILQFAISQTRSIQIAFKTSVIDNDTYYLWSAWASRDLLKPAWFDYNDHFTFKQAGSPLKENPEYYPIKSLFGLDNTCRQGVGFEMTGYELGGCKSPPPPTPLPADEEPAEPAAP